MHEKNQNGSTIVQTMASAAICTVCNIAVSEFTLAWSHSGMRSASTQVKYQFHGILVKYTLYQQRDIVLAALVQNMITRVNEC